MPDETPKRRRAWLFYLALALILGALPLGYLLFLGEDPPPPPPAPPAVVKPKGPVEVRLGSLSGTVQVRSAGGEWAPAAEGQTLKSSDAVRTGNGSYAVLIGGDAFEVRMEPGTEVSVEELAASISRLMLTGGMATAKVNGAARHTFELKAAGSDAVARTQAGAFAISNNGEGTVAVGTREGEVELLGAGRVVIVRAGQQSIVQPGSGPSDPTPIPRSLLLKVKWPDGEINRKRLVLAGQVDPGSWVEVRGRVVRVDREGRFSEPLALAEGQNEIKVRTKSVGGLDKDEKKDVRVDTTPAKFGLDPNIWK